MKSHFGKIAAKPGGERGGDPALLLDCCCTVAQQILFILR